MFAGSKTVSSERNDYIMKATGIVRRIDDLGRVVIPKEIRRTMRIREGTPLEIYTSVDGEVIFRKYSLSEKFQVRRISTQMYCTKSEGCLQLYATVTTL